MTYRRIAATILFAAAALVAAPPQHVLIREQQPRSESMDSTRDGTLYIGSMTKGEIFRAPAGAATADVWIKPGTNGLQRNLGVVTDEKTNTLWACSSPFQGSTEKTALKTFNLKTGAPTGSYDFPGGTGLCNDIAIAADGTVYATDTTGARVVRLRPGASAMDVWAQDSRFRGIDGIAFGDPTTIYVNNYFSGQIFRIPVEAGGGAGAFTAMQTSQPLSRPDGMRPIARNVFLLIEGAGRLDRVTLDGDKANVEVLSSGYNTPTAVTRVGNTAWVLAAMNADPPLVHAVPLSREAAAAQASGHDWPMMGYNVQGDNASPAPTGINADNVKTLVRRQVTLDGTVDSSPIYLHDVKVKGASHNVFFVTTTYGKTIAIDADSGAILWEYTPAGYASWAGSRQITNATPAADPDRAYIYAATPGGTVNKLAVSDGHLVWSTAVTLAPASEKLASPLKLFRGHLVVVTGGYIGDRPPYQGHVAIIDAANGKLLHVWNSLCSNQAGLLQPSTCSGQQSAIWGRSGAAIDPATGTIFVSTGNGNYNGKTNWGDSLIELNPEATKMIGNWTPANNAAINRGDFDLITTPMLMGDGNLVQTGKDIKLRLLSLKQIVGTAAHSDHELQIVTGPGTPFITLALAKWTHNGRTWLYAGDEAWRGPAGGLAAWTYANGKLTPAWKNDTPATAPVLADGLLYAYDGYAGSLRVYNPETGAQVAALACGTGHWNTPIVVDGKIALPEGNANEHATTGVLDIWSLPKTH